MCAEQIAGPSQQPKMTIDDKLEISRKYKEAGNELYKAKNFKAAIGKYHRALLFIKGIEKHCDKSDISGFFGDYTISKKALYSEEMEFELRNLKAGCYNNLAACLLQQENASYEKIIHYCDEVLNIDPRNVKALYRKGVACYNSKDYEQSKEILKEASKYSSSTDANIQRYITLCEKHLQRHKAIEKERYKGMFGKSANADL